MRSTEAKETAKLSDFQEELVQVAAALKGEPLKLVENMNVSSGLKHVKDALKKFYDDGQNQKAKEINFREERFLLIGLKSLIKHTHYH
ncbi:hypothetical protein V6N12_053630 [Hibiscus sabdariffa]|uniref:Uncharacterized protein n=1 Tax=Hibiscus sabdariffa TaxID=183260 RepID=A0ABR2D860_9ROSI